MNLQTIIDAQKELDARIIKEKGLEGKDLVANTYVALDTELGEFANEGRWFKHWSKNQNPNTIAFIDKKCSRCKGSGEEPNSSTYYACVDCFGTGVKGEHKNPLLEEFVDSVHFFVSIAIQRGWEDVLWIYEEQVDPKEFNGDLTSYYLELKYFLNKSFMEIPNKEIAGLKEDAYHFRLAWILFLNIGMNGFGFTWEQIYDAYFEKNKENHRRQEDGY